MQNQLDKNCMNLPDKKQTPKYYILNPSYLFIKFVVWVGNTSQLSLLSF